MKTAGQVVTFLTFITGGVIGMLDALGFLHGYPLLEHATPKIALVLIGLIGSGFLIEHWTSIRSIEKDSGEVAKAVTRIDRTLSDVSQLSHPTRLLPSRQDHYLSFLEAVSSAPQHSTVDVTHFEKLMGTPYDIGENSAEELFVKKWKEKIINGELEVRQIVHVSSLHDLQEVEARLAAFKDCLNYSMNVAYGQPGFPYLDLALIKGHWAALDMSSDAVEPFRAATSLEFRNATMLDALSRYFDIWWSQFSIPLKSKNGVNVDTLQLLKGLLPEAGVSAGRTLYPEFSFVEQKEPVVRQLVQILVDTSVRLHIPSVRAAYQSEFDRVLRSAAVDLQSTFERPKVIDRALVESLLIDAVTYATKQIHAVSYDTDQELFWNSPFGQRLFQANQEAVKRIPIHRIFLLTRAQYAKEGVNSLLRRQAKAGVHVYYAHTEDFDPTLLRDFLIMDERLVFDMAVVPGSQPVKDGTLMSSADAISKHHAIFKNLRLKSIQYGENQRHL